MTNYWKGLHVGVTSGHRTTAPSPYPRPPRLDWEWRLSTLALVHDYPFDAHCCHMGTAIKHPVPDRVKPSFVIFDILALWRSEELTDVVPLCSGADEADWAVIDVGDLGVSGIDVDSRLRRWTTSSLRRDSQRPQPVSRGAASPRRVVHQLFHIQCHWYVVNVLRKHIKHAIYRCLMNNNIYAVL